MNYKTGDKLIAKKNFYILGDIMFTKGNVYRITNIDEDDDSICMVDDEGDDAWWDLCDIDEIFGGKDVGNDNYDYAMGVI